MPGVKVVSVFPGNAARGKPSVTGVYLLLDGDSGEPLAALDGPALTLWRTAAASALAASYLARAEARRMAMVGAGALAPRLIAMHAAMRPIEEVLDLEPRPRRARSASQTRWAVPAFGCARPPISPRRLAKPTSSRRRR